MSAKGIFFDLDGTLSDSGEGIIKCAKLALNHFGLPIPDEKAMRTFVGPPLSESFMRYGVPADQVDEAIRIYRSRYLTVGKFENFPYPGIPEMLAYLQAKGYRLFVATSKPETTSIEILNHFNLSQYFERICGATMDGSRSTKSQVIAYLLEQINDLDSAVMVGDTAFDVIGAAEHSIPAIGVAWGYGTVESMIEAGASAIADSVTALQALLDN